MRYYGIYDLMQFLSSFLVIYLILVIFIFLRQYLKSYRYNKRLIFTRDSLKELKQQIDDITDMSCMNRIEMADPYDNLPKRDAEKILSLYNEYAIGINEGLYDELYIKLIMGKQMTSFYKRFNRAIMEDNQIFDDDSQYIPLELLLKRWDSNEAPVYRVKNRRSLY